MADDHRRCAGVLQHLGANVSRERTGDFGVAVLTTDGDTASSRLRRPVKQGRRNTDQHVDGWRFGMNGCGYGLDLLELRGQSVHLPVSGDQEPHGHLSPLLEAETLYQGAIGSFRGYRVSGGGPYFRIDAVTNII
jgi:hypothetical protein